MRKLAVLVFQSLDGVMQAPAVPGEDMSGDFAHGGWAADYWPDVMEQVERDAMSEPFDIVFGRKTYEIFAGHWPDAPPSKVGAKLNRATKYVVTTQAFEPTWENSTVVTGDIVAEIGKLKSSDGPLLQVQGSCSLIQTLLAHDLVDEFRLWTFPVILGSGKRLFGDGARLANLSLIKTDATPNGVIGAIYRRES